MRRNSSPGFTLTEVIVAVAIFAIIFVAALMIYDRSNRVFKTGVESSDMQQSTRVAFDKMVSDLRMAGFDFDRDGAPTIAGQAQQPDEQIEYAGPSAVTIRANFDFDDQATRGGRVTAIEAPNSQFPIVTTGNDEIVTYVLRSEDASKNTDTLVFYADVTDGSAEARQTFTGGEAEDKIEIPNVDLCAAGCNNPPYTLYRATLDAEGEPVMTPLASNIRSMTVEYFRDAVGNTPLTAAELSDPGGGQYDPANPSLSAAPRAVRSTIRSMRVNVVGMNEVADPNYTDPDPNEIASAEHFRKFSLESMVVARNLGRRGIKETVEAAPGKPTLDSVCFGYCAGVKLSWTAPASTTAGAVEGYIVLYDTDTTNVTDPPAKALNVGYSTSFYLAGLDPTTEYRFTIAATNSYGTSYADQYVVGTPKNATKMSPPTAVAATDSTAPLANLVELSWDAPITNESGVITCKAPNGSTTTVTEAPQTQERKGYEVWRGTETDFTKATGTLVGTTSSTATTFNDTTVANCKTYYYRVRVAEHCTADPQNETAGIQWSDFEPAGDPAVTGYAESGVAPEAPTALQVVSESCSSPGLGVGISCTVDLAWPKVMQDVDGASIEIAEYEINGTYDDGAGGVTTLVPVTVNVDTGGVFGPSSVQYPLNIKKPAPTGKYSLTVRAQQCGAFSDPSPVATYPSCVFAGGGQLVAVPEPTIGGTGSDVSPYEVVGAGSIGVGTSSGGTLATVSAKAYAVSSNQLLADLGTQSGSFASATFSWPGGEDGAIYRIDVTATDTGGCSSFTSIFLTQVTVSCPFLDGDTTNDPDVETTVNNANVEFSLKNFTQFGATIDSIDISWNQSLTPIKNEGKSNEAKTTIDSVYMPDGASMILVNTTGDKTTSGIFTATPGAAVDPVAANDQTGNYTVRVNFAIPTGSGNLTTNPITGMTITYTLAGSQVECTVFP